MIFKIKDQHWRLSVQCTTAAQLFCITHYAQPRSVQRARARALSLSLSLSPSLSHSSSHPHFAPDSSTIKRQFANWTAIQRKVMKLTNLTTNRKGAYTRNPSKHVGADGATLVIEHDRYHLHVALACPWACGTLSMLQMKGLEDAVTVSVVHPTWQRTKPDDAADTHCGWVYKAEGDAALSNPLGHGSFECDAALRPDIFTHAQTVREVYERVGDLEGPFTTPCLVDKKRNVIVSNESMEILKIFHDDFKPLHTANLELDLYPADKDAELRALNDEVIYPHVNNGVYRAGFARSQDSYDTAVSGLFTALETLEARLGKMRFLSGDAFSWLDLRLFHTLVRFDPVYTCYFKANVKRIEDFPNLLGFMRDVYSIEPIGRSINMQHVKTHYYTRYDECRTFL